MIAVSRVVVGGGGVDEHHAGDLVGVPGCEGQGVEPAEGVAGDDVGAGDVRAVEQRVEVGGDRKGILGAAGVLAPPSAGPVVDADPRLVGDGLGDPAQVGGHLAAAGLDHDGGAAGPGAAQVKAVPAHVNQATRHGD